MSIFDKTFGNIGRDPKKYFSNSLTRGLSPIGAMQDTGDVFKGGDPNSLAYKNAMTTWDEGARDLASRQNAVNQNMVRQGGALNNGSQTTMGMWNTLATNSMHDETGSPTGSLFGMGMQALGYQGGALGTGLAIGAAALAPLALNIPGVGEAFSGFGDWLNGPNRTGDASQRQALQAGAFSEAQNRQQRNSIVSQANSAFDTMNLQNEGQGYAMTDAAIGNASNYEMGKQAIGMSGIEGGNMMRNLDYGMDRAEGQQQLQYLMMGNQGQGVNSGMASTFDQLSQNTARSVGSAYSQGMMNELGALNGGRTQAGLYNMQHQVTRNDYTALQGKVQKAYNGGMLNG